MSNQVTAEANETTTADTVPLRRNDSTGSSAFRCLFPDDWAESQTTDESQQPEEDPATDDFQQANEDQATDDSNPDTPTNHVAPCACARYTTPEDPRPACAADTTPEDLKPVSNVDATPEDPETPVGATDITHVRAADTTPVRTVDATPEDPDTTHVRAADTTPEDSTSPTSAPFASPTPEDPNIMDQHEYRELICTQSQHRRIVRNSSNPKLYQHQRRPKASICIFDAVDDAVYLAATGVLWHLDGKQWQIVFVASLGMTEQRRRSRSHKVSYSSSPLYIIFRRSVFQGQEIKFEQLHRLVASAMFREGRPHHEVSFPNLTRAKSNANKFIENDEERSTEKWVAIPYMRTEAAAKKKKEEEQQRRALEKQAAQKRKQLQERAEARTRRARELLELKRAEQQARAVAQEAARKTASAERQKNQRAMQRQVKASVLNHVQQLEETLMETLEEKVNSCVKSCAKNVKSCVEMSVENVKEEVNDLEARIGTNETQITSNETMMKGLLPKSVFEKQKTDVNKRFKFLAKEVKKVATRLEKSLKTLNTINEQKSLKTLNTINEQPARIDEGGADDTPRPPARKRVKRHIVDWRPPLDMPPRTEENTRPLDHVPMATRPLQMRMSQSRGADESQWSNPWAHRMMSSRASATSSPVMPAVRNVPRYISPVFAQRNYTTTKFM